MLPPGKQAPPSVFREANIGTLPYLYPRVVTLTVNALTQRCLSFTTSSGFGDLEEQRAAFDSVTAACNRGVMSMAPASGTCLVCRN